MKVEFQQDPACTEPRVLIRAAQMTGEVAGLIRRLTDAPPAFLMGFRDEQAVPLDPAQIIRIYAQAGKVLADTAQGSYVLRPRLCDLEARLDATVFVRISNSEIINLRHCQGFDLKLTGTICVALTGGVVTYVPRRYMKQIRQALARCCPCRPSWPCRWAAS